MSDTPRPPLRLVPRKDHFTEGTGVPKISPFHPAWGNIPMEERLQDERVEKPKPQLKLVGGGSGGNKKPPKKTKTGGDGWDEKPEKKSEHMEMEFTEDSEYPKLKKPKKPKTDDYS